MGQKDKAEPQMTSVVLWVEDLTLAKSFYESLLSASVVETSESFIHLASGSNEVFLHLMPEQYHEGIATPPKIREDAVMKPVYDVSSIIEARMAVAELNGKVQDESGENSYSGSKRCDGFDAEGNVFQLAETKKSADPQI